MSHSPEPLSPVLSILCGVNDVDFNASRMDTLCRLDFHRAKDRQTAGAEKERPPAGDLGLHWLVGLFLATYLFLPYRHCVDRLHI